MSGGITLENFRPWPCQEELLRSMMHSHDTQLVLHANRSGASTVAAAWIASMATDIPIVTADGVELFMRPDHLRGKPVTLWCGAQDWWATKEQVIHTLLTNKRKDSIGMIDDRHLREGSMTWENKRDGLLRRVTLQSGAVIVFQPQTSIDWMNGSRIHGTWIDEQIKDRCIFSEIATRTIDAGQLIWTVTPQQWLKRPSVSSKTTEALVEHSKRSPYTHVTRFRSRGIDYRNKSLPDE